MATKRPKPIIHGRDHLPGGADPIPIRATRAIYFSGLSVAPYDSTPFEWDISSGTELLDVSSPLDPVVLQSGIYAVTFHATSASGVPAGDAPARYIRWLSAFSLPKNTRAQPDLSSHGVTYTNDTDGTDTSFLTNAADYTGDNYSFALAHPGRITILTDGVYRLRYFVGVNETFFTESQYEINVEIGGALDEAHSFQIDETVHGTGGLAGQAIVETTFLVENAPVSIELYGLQTSANDWVYDGGGDPLFNLGSASAELLKVSGVDSVGDVATVQVSLDTANLNASTIQTFPLRAAHTSDPALGAVTYAFPFGSVSLTFYVPAGGGITAEVSHSAAVTKSFNAQAILQLLG